MLLLERFPTNNTSDGDIGGIDQQNATAEFIHRDVVRLRRAYINADGAR